jgi:hypothetical protein
MVYFENAFRLSFFHHSSIVIHFYVTSNRLTFCSVFSFLRPSLNFFLLQYPLHLTSSPFTATLCATRSPDKNGNKEQWELRKLCYCLSIRPGEPADSVNVRAGTVEGNSGRWNGTNSDIRKPRAWSLWCHRQREMPAVPPVMQLLLLRDTAVQYIGVWPALCYQRTTAHTVCPTHCVHCYSYPCPNC